MSTKRTLRRAANFNCSTALFRKHLIQYTVRHDIDIFSRLARANAVDSRAAQAVKRKNNTLTSTFLSYYSTQRMAYQSPQKLKPAIYLALIIIVAVFFNYVLMLAIGRPQEIISSAALIDRCSADNRTVPCLFLITD